MPTFHVTAPDGHVLEVNGPEGSTQEQAIEQAKKQYTPKSQDTPVQPPSFLDQAGDFASQTLSKTADLLTAPFRLSTYVGIAKTIADPRTAFAQEDTMRPKAPERQPIGMVDKLRFVLAGGQPENQPSMRAPQGDWSDVASNVLAAGIGGKLVEKSPSIVRGAKAVGTGLKVAAPDLVGGGSMIAGGEMLSHLPGMEWPARIALDYPGARQIAKGMHAGYNATREALKNPAKVAPITETDLPGGQDLGAAERLKKQLNKFSKSETGSSNPEKMKQIYDNLRLAISEDPTPTSYSDFPSARKVGPVEMPNAAPETPQAGPVAPINKPIIPSSGLTPKGGEVEPGGRPTEVATEVIKPGTGAPGDFNGPKLADEAKQEPDQWTWESLKDQHGQAAVDRVRAKYSDLADRLKSSNMSLQEFLDLPQETKDQIVQVPRHPTNPKRPKYSSGYNPKYENLFKEIHGGDQ